jgi:hypothetical protein
MDPILGYKNPVHILVPYLFEVYFDVTLAVTLFCSFPGSRVFFFALMRATRAVHDIPRALVIVTTRGGECKFIIHCVRKLPSRPTIFSGPNHVSSRNKRN